MNTSRRVVQVCALLTSVLLVACSGSDDPADPDQKPPVEALGIEPETATVPSGARTTLRAVLLRDGKRVGVVSATSWVSADPTVAQVTAPGRIRGLHTGQINVRANYDTMTASANIVVTPGSPVRITLGPKNSSLLIGKTTRFTTTSFDSIGNQIRQLNSGVSYTSNDPSRVSIAPTGLAEAKGVGPARLRAAYLSFRDSTDVSVTPRQIALTIAGTGRDEWRTFDLVIYEPLTHIVERSVVVTFVDLSDGNRNVSGGAVTIDGNPMSWDGTKYTASVLGSATPTFMVAATGSPENYVEPFSVVTRLAPMLDINIGERATYHVPNADEVKWTPLDPNAQLLFKLYTWIYAPPGYVAHHYYNDWIPDSGSFWMHMTEVPVHFMILTIDRTIDTPLSLTGYSDVTVTNRSTARRQVFTWK